MDNSVKTTILDVSLNLFKRFGYKKTTIEDIAQLARIGKGSVYLYFKSKEEILYAIIRNHQQGTIGEWIKIIHKDWPVEKKISIMLKTNITQVQKNREEMSTDMLPKHMIEEILKISEETKAQKIALLATVLDSLISDEDKGELYKLAGILLDFSINILFRLYMDRGFAWEQFFDETLNLLLLPKAR
jgi:AcrR family transcriptional regulator